MKKIRNNEAGFSAIELVLVIVVVALIGISGWLVYEDHHKSTTTTTTTKSTGNTITSNLYAGWKSFCSSSGGLCFKYPSNWKLDSTSVISPSGDTYVVYIPGGYDDGGSDYGPGSYNILSISTISSTSNLKVVKAICTDINIPPNYDVDYFITTNSEIQQQNIVAGTSVNSLTSDFNNPNGNTSSAPEKLYVSSYNNSPNVNGLDNQFTTLNAAQAWFNNPEIQTAGQIIGSVYYN
jgi:hypothetical protein